jgi:uncharacterized protein (TIGR02996 family)
VIDGLAQTLDALRVDDRASALSSLRAAWKVSRSPQLAELLTQLGQEAARALPRLDGPKDTRKVVHERWIDLATQRRLVDVPRLLDTLRFPPWTKLGERVERLVRFDDDPRIALALAEFVRELPVLSSVKNGSWATLISLIGRIGDPRTRMRVEARLAIPPGSIIETECIYPRLEKALAEVPTAPLLEVDANDLQVIADLENELRRLSAGPAADESAVVGKKLAPARSAEQLLAAVYDNPADDEPRQVYGDFLQEQGDVVGELIALQVERGRNAAKGQKATRERELLKSHLAEALGPLEPVVIPRTAKLERGFLAVAAVRFKTPAQQRALATHPAWRTLVELVPASKDTNDVLVRSAPLVSLERLSANLPEMATALLESPLTWPRLTELSLGWVGRDRVLERLLESKKFEALQSLGVWSVDTKFPAWLRKQALFAKLQRLKLGSVPTAPLTLWVKLVTEAPVLRELTLGSLSIRRDAGRFIARFDGQRFTTWDADVLMAFRGVVTQAYVHAEQAPGLSKVKGIEVALS